jgi:hypothetical protein
MWAREEAPGRVRVAPPPPPPSLSMRASEREEDWGRGRLRDGATGTRVGGVSSHGRTGA